MYCVPAILSGHPEFDMSVPFVRPALPPFERMETSVRELLCSGQLTKGKHLEAFEQAVAKHLGVKHAIGVSSCTTGLMLTYRGLGLKGDVVVPSFTFMATVSALVWAGLRPVFADVDPSTGTIDVASAERAITPRTTAIVGVHTFGNPAAIDELEALCNRRKIKLVFDAAHGFGALYRGKPLGAQGDANVFSLSPTKLLVAGEGGIVATNCDQLAKQVRLGREYGNDGSYDSLFAGINARMGEFNALLGLHSLGILPDVAARRNALAQLYCRELASIPGIQPMRVRSGDRCSYKDFSVAVHTEEFGLSRDQLSQALAVEQIDTRKYFSPAAHQQTAYRVFAPESATLPHTVELAANSLSLPMYTQLEEEQVTRIALVIRRIHEHAGEVRMKLSGVPRPHLMMPITSSFAESVRT